MKKKKVILVLLCICFITIFLVFTFYNENNATENGSTIEMQENTSVASLNSIKTSLTTSGEILSGNTEKISLNTNYSFSTMCVEEGESVTEGQKLIKYTNGTYLQAPYNCVLISSSEKQEICTSSNYVELKSLDSLAMSLQIDELEINKVSIGDEAEIQITSTNEILTGYVTKISEVGTYSISGSTFSTVVSLANNGN